MFQAFLHSFFDYQRSRDCCNADFFPRKQLVFMFTLNYFDTWLQHISTQKYDQKWALYHIELNLKIIKI